ncbi:MAG TPA: Fic family protein, partial [Kofleriaceae bacterium]|nr:Fic family protein [Kofleriaceae bacterium]
LEMSSIPLLPFAADIETKPVLKKLARAHAALAELKGVVASIPNQAILVSTLPLQEAKDSSAIENIVTTEDELFSSDSAAEIFASIAAKEVHNYATALRQGFEAVVRTQLLTINDILNIQALIEENNAGFRRLPGTALKHSGTGATVYTPPQHGDEIIALMTNLEAFINNDELCDWDPLVKMAVMHHQFETIHPFYDGNGRTGRILNILYLVKAGLLGAPVLYLSRYISQRKAEYYALLQAVRDQAPLGNVAAAWEPWLLFMLGGVEETSRQTTALVIKIRELMAQHKRTVRAQLPKIYSQDLIDNLFKHPYTRVEFMTKDLLVHRNTATTYLDALVGIGLLSKHKRGKESYYLND